ncbi:peptidoglycan D,D-transpeptidase FtsI family protein [Serinibacter salmoneus]|uniref:Cell division protein FtsI (Penicillin-binding protein 3) n=1 Tax=Serinibacter salmoneus TaxID=556530 RepID=A0A2A9CZ29_9MICO|nr:penicillin-binding protein 2 [Serinibacter salmoneus]PFG19381.1 cell division protein FtsI (penicillin-binding protein 3) [Serinibacter salmoneus]
MSRSARGTAPRVGSPHTRQRAMLWGVLIVLALFGARLVQVQVIQSEALAAEARATRERTYTLAAQRGDIVDSTGVTFATSQIRYDVEVDQRQIPAFVVLDEDGEIASRGAVAAADLLAPLLDRDPHELGAQLTGDRGYLLLASEVTPEVRESIEALGINGLTTRESTTRVYPAGTTAGSIIGWLNADDEGAAGLEYSLNEQLTGTDGERTVEIGRRGEIIPSAAQSTTAAQDGLTVHTSINSDVQYQCQEVMDRYTKESQASWSAAVVVEVDTGRIIALCDSAQIDPNDPEGYATINSVQYSYEPGSTGKILTMAAALNEGVVTPETVFDIPYQFTTPNGQTFKDFAPHPDREMTAAGILAVSSNTGTVQIGDLMSDETRAEYMEAFGWHEPTGVELAGESGGLNMDPANWDGRTRYATMFGQGIGVNLLQNVGVIATLANDGVRMPLHLVDGYSGSDGVLEPAEIAEGVEVVTPQTAQEMVTILEGVVANDGATGTKAAVPGYRVAGKTGTAEVPDDTGALTETAASFVGTIPADDPKLAIGVVVYRAQINEYGGLVAAPAFNEIASFAVERLGIAPSASDAELYPVYGADDPYLDETDG